MYENQLKGDKAYVVRPETKKPLEKNLEQILQDIGMTKDVSDKILNT